MACLLAVMGPSTYGILRNLVYLEKPKDKSLDKISNILEERFTEKKVEIAERFRFYTAMQESETIAQFVSRLKKLARYCNFGDKLNDMIRDRLVCGIKDRNTQKKLLVESGLTREKAIKVAIADEAANKDVAGLAKARGLVPTNEVHRMNATPSKPLKPKTNKEDNPLGEPKCKHCGKRNHPAEKCKFKRAACHKCNKQGHIAPVCKSSKKSQVHAVEEKLSESKENTNEEFDDYSYLYNIQGGSENPIVIEIEIENQQFCMEIDTGSGKSIIGENLYKDKFSNLPLKQSPLTFVTHTKKEINPLGYVDVEVQYGILQRHDSLFNGQLGKLNGIEAKLNLKAGATPVFHKARLVLFTKKSKISGKLNLLESQGIIEKVPYSEWAAPIVAVDKPDGGIKICRDFKVTVNPELEVHKYPLPRIDEIFSNIAGGEKISKLDLSHAFLQIEVAEKCRPLLTVNTHQGLYQYKRVVYGIASAPALWQKAMNQVLQGIPGTQCYIDDIIVTGKNDQEHCKNFDKAMTRLEGAGLKLSKLNKTKCEFMKNEIEYCGHVINKEDTPWHWTKEQEATFTKVKSMVTSDTVLTHYNPDKELRLATDASAYDIGCVLSHVTPDGSERPIAFASRTLNDTEKVYPQLQKEALSIVWGVKKFQSEEFENFLKMNGIQHLTSAPYHPRTNGLAERFVRVMKEALKSNKGSTSLRYKLDTFLMKYRNCPHTTTGNSPAVMVMGHPLRCSMDLLNADITSTVEKSFVTAPSSKQMRHFNLGTPVLARNYGKGNLWSKGVVSKQTGPVSYQVQVSTSTWRRHLDQLIRSELPITGSTPVTMTTNEPQVSEENYQESQINAPLTVDTPDVNSSQVISESQNRTPDDVKSNENSNTQAPVRQDSELRESRPMRNRKSPVWMKDYVAK
ncbi:Uncharacterized protein K02A2.6 [Stylophora pistillata]|uniref:Uncharacterized protein K02A2.6 n=1 Tax=Stylophora pistillata TaxID=50429 RepID=A0A2B4S417_STYPI|nr:Uncharacterized protein K02A2.6 [Stylophora pistillata]